MKHAPRRADIRVVLAAEAATVAALEVVDFLEGKQESVAGNGCASAALVSVCKDRQRQHEPAACHWRGAITVAPQKAPSIPVETDAVECRRSNVARDG